MQVESQARVAKPRAAARFLSLRHACPSLLMESIGSTRLAERRRAKLVWSKAAADSPRIESQARCLFVCPYPIPRLQPKATLEQCSIPVPGLARGRNDV